MHSIPAVGGGIAGANNTRRQSMSPCLFSTIKSLAPPAMEGKQHRRSFCAANNTLSHFSIPPVVRYTSLGSAGIKAKIGGVRRPQSQQALYSKKGSKRGNYRMLSVCACACVCECASSNFGASCQASSFLFLLYQKRSRPRG